MSQELFQEWVIETQLKTVNGGKGEFTSSENWNKERTAPQEKLPEPGSQKL